MEQYDESTDLIVLVNVQSLDGSLKELWARSNFWHRASSLGGRLFAVGPQDPGSVTHCEWIEAPVELSRLFELEPECPDVAVLLDAAQVFFDTEIVLAGLKKFLDRQCDYFTQWEHARLPIGMGARFLRFSRWSSDGLTDQEQYLAKILRNPYEFKIGYDETKYVPDRSYLLDSRYSGDLFDLLNHSKVNNWNLEGFQQFAIESKLEPSLDEFNGLPAEGVSGFCDERGISAAFGFEDRRTARFPTYVMFDLTNFCNAACVHCPQSVNFLGKEKQTFLALDAFKSVIDECSQYHTDFIRITADGEPLLHPEIWQMLDYAGKHSNARIGLTTNGSALNRANVKKLLDAQIFMIDVSLDAFSKETFEVIRAGLNFDRVISNVLRLLEFREQNAAANQLKVMVSFVKQKENEHEEESFVAFWQEKVDRVLIREMISNVGKNKDHNLASADGLSRWPCPHWWRRVVINYDGQLKACPVDWEGGLINTDISTRTVEEQWHDDFYFDYRMQHLNNSHKVTSICRDCLDWQGTPWDLGYEKVVAELEKEK